MAPSETPVEIDTGTAYGMGVPSFDPDLIEVEAGTPTGEMLRRYWHPFAVAADATGVPKAVRVLGEDLILFRDGQGVVAHGRMDGQGTFVAEKILAKHDENYMAPEVADSLAKHVQDQTSDLPETPTECNPL